MSKRADQQALTVVPLTFADACQAVDRLHRHHKRPQGHKFSLGVLLADGSLCGVAIIGRPVARCFDTGWQVEVTRVATDGTPNACSALYGAAWRTASAAGYVRAITYTQGGESGASLRAVGWRRAAELTARRGWDTPSRRRAARGADHIARTLWEQARSDAPTLPAIAVLRDEIRDEIRCLTCGHPMELHQRRGRPQSYCSRSCQQKAYRRRAAA